MSRRSRFNTIIDCILISLVVAILTFALIMSLTGCAIPVRAVTSDQAILVAPVGRELPMEDGTTALNPDLPQPKADAYRPAAAFPWGALIAGAATLLFGGGAGTVAVRTIGRLKSATRIACDLADSCAQAETDDQVQAAKERAKMQQEAAGVRTLTQSLRGK